MLGLVFYTAMKSRILLGTCSCRLGANCGKRCGSTTDIELFYMFMDAESDEVDLYMPLLDNY